MMAPTPMLQLICGKIAAGKSTLAANLAEENQAVLLSEDIWLNALFADQLTSASDYVRCAEKLTRVMGPHVISLLQAGVSVVLDFPANTPEMRRWMRHILDETAVAHHMHVLMPSDEVCLERLRIRNARGEHPFAVTEAQFHRFSKHFSPPVDEEGFNVVRHTHDG